MRIIIILIGFLSFSNLNMNAQNQKEVSSQISDVVVYLNRAQITRTANISLTQGKTSLLFKNITPDLSPNSLQVSTGKGVTILSVNHSIDYLNSNKSDKLIEKRNEIQDSISLSTSRIEVLKKEQEMLMSNKSIGGNQNGVDLERLVKAADFFRQRLTQIEEKSFQIQQDIKSMQNRLDKINRQISELNAQSDQPTSNIKITVTADRTLTSPIQLSYTVRQASWQPSYDIRINETDAPVTLVYKAKVFQNTQENWNNVNLTLSTGNPSISNYKPELQPWSLYLPAPPPPKVSATLNIADNDAMQEEMVIQEKEARPMRIRGVSSLGKQNVTTTQQQTTTAFEIQIPYTIPSDNQGYDVAVSDHQIEADYQYATVPKLSPHVYLLAQMTDWNELNLLPGQANIYFDNTYQGKTHLDPYTSKDTLKLSIGRDPSILIERELQKDFSAKSFFGNNVKETKSWKITVRNTKNTKVSIVIEDQYPITTNNEVKVELEESSGAKVNSKTGIVNWNWNWLREKLKNYG